MVMTDPRIDRADAVHIVRSDVAAGRQEILLAAARWWRLEAGLAQALAEERAEERADERASSRVAP